VVPIVFHTGKKEWRKNRELAELIGGPEAFRKFAPIWRPMFLDLGGQTPAELLQAAGEWLAALAVVRADQDQSDAFDDVLQKVLRRLEGLAESDKSRWHDLIRFVLLWALYRRSPEDHAHLVESVRASQSNVARQTEVQTMGQTIAQSLIAEGRLEMAREFLRDLLEEKFSPLPESVLERIRSETDPTRLKAAGRRVRQISSLDEFQI
jgi:hypothetical protein